MITQSELAQRQSLPLDMKERFSEVIIRQFIEECGKPVHVSVSGIDSAVLWDLVHRVDPTVPGYFVDTGLEDPTVVDHARQTDNVTIIKPDVLFHDVITTCGYPIISKTISRALQDIQNPTARNAASVKLRLTGIKRDGTKCHSSSKLSKKYFHLIDCGFKFSAKCCDLLKKNPLKRLKSVPFIGTLAEDSEVRGSSYLKTGCNTFSKNNTVSRALSIWTRQDIYAYILKYDIKFPRCYGRITYDHNGFLTTTGEKHTGCQFCLFGIMFDLLRIERLKELYPSRYKYCMETLRYRELLPLLLGVSTYDEYLMIARGQICK